MKSRLTYSLLILFIVIGCQQQKQEDKMKFNKEEWIRGDIRTRGRMVNDIIEDSILIGKSKKEIVNLLGEQGDTTANFSYQVDIGLRTGPFGLGGVWPFTLNIHFDTLNSKVIDVKCTD